MKILLLLPLLFCIGLVRGMMEDSGRFHGNSLKKTYPGKVKIKPYELENEKKIIIRKITTRSMEPKNKKRYWKKETKKFSRNHKSNLKNSTKTKSKKVKSKRKLNKNRQKKKTVKQNQGKSSKKKKKSKGKAKTMKANSGGLLLYSRNGQQIKLIKERGSSLCNTVTLLNEGEELIIHSDTKRSPVQCTAEFKGSDGISLGIQCGRFALHTGGCNKESLQVSRREKDDIKVKKCKKPHCEGFCVARGPELESSTGFLRIMYSRIRLKRAECSYGLICSIYGGSAKPNIKDTEAFEYCSGSCCSEKEYPIKHTKSSSSVSSINSSIPLHVVLLLWPLNVTPKSDNTEYQPVEQSDSFLPKISTPPMIPPSPISCPPQTISSKGCGRSAPQRVRIINGRDAYPGEFPWAVFLFSMSDGQITGKCGGTLISSGWILSAAHCFYKTYNYDKVLATMGNVKMSSDYATMQSIFQVITHPYYSDIFLTNDIALLQLVEYVSFTDFISPICLATSEEENQMKSNDQRATVIGWGSMKQDEIVLSQTLQKVDLDIISLESCRSYYSRVRTFPINDGHICTYTIGKDACQGDSGSGLYHLLESGRWVQVGVVSWGVGCAQDRRPGIFTRTLEKLQWINTVINNITC